MEATKRNLLKLQHFTLEMGYIYYKALLDTLSEKIAVLQFYPSLNLKALKKLKEAGGCHEHESLCFTEKMLMIYN